MPHAQPGELQNSEAGRSLVSPEDLLRAGLYRLLARYLTGPAGAQALRDAAGLSGDSTALGVAITRFADAARQSDVVVVGEAYHDLFVGLGRGILVPFGSYYLTGFLHEKPLAKLRQSMAEHGIGRDEDINEPEDHIASVAEMMAGLIDGTFGPPLDLAGQKRFYSEHVGPWAPYFFRDLAANTVSRFYAALGDVGIAFLEIEERAFRMV